jgi:helix-turn-helix protein
VVNDEQVRAVSRRLRDLVEPIAANVYFAKEAQEAYGELGLGYIPGYFCSRSACMGNVPGEVVVSAFGVFNPDIVLPAIAEGRAKTDIAALLDARERGATASLERILGGLPEDAARATEILRRAADAATCEGHALFAGLRSLGFPGSGIGDLWRSADLVREHRGDSHVCAWVSHGIDAVEITLLTELWWRLPLNSYVRTRGWTDDHITAATDRLRERGLVEGDGFTPEGQDLRASIEEATDRQERAIVEAIGGDADELFARLEPWSKAVVEAGGYPADPSSLTRK